jgi:anti-sigma B factor antagonist
VIDLVEVTYPRPGACVIALRGEHDLTTADRSERLLREALALNDHVVVDISGAEFIDSSILRILLVTDRRAKAAGKVFRLQMATAPIVRSVLEVTGVLEKLDVAYSPEDALRSGSDDGTEFWAAPAVSDF